MFAVVALVAARPAYADDPPPEPPPPRPQMGPDDGPATGEPAPGPDVAIEEPPPAIPHEDSEFGPVIQIEQIDITGNTATRTEIIRRALRINPGEVLHSSDKRLRDARFKVLALGFFRDVSLAVRKGSQRGQVIVEVHVVERGTIVLNRLWFGTTALSPWWLGADVGERNLLGTGIAVGGGFIYAKQSGDTPGARDQYAAELRAAQSSVLGSPWGLSAAATLVHGSEPYRVAGPPDDDAARLQRAFAYRRMGVRLGASYDLSPLTTLSMGLRAEQIDATLPEAPTRTFADGHVGAVDLHLDPGSSQVVTASLAFDRDTRPDPVLPHAGGHILLSAELGGALLGGSYDFATLFGRYEHYWPLVNDRHAIAIKLAGGVVVGDAPRFDRIYIADVDRMLTPRALGLVLSTAAPLSFLGTRGDKPTYGDLGGSATVEYTVQLFRGQGKRRVYGGDAFFGAGVWGLAEDVDLHARDTSISGALPIDLYLDAGIRLDTDLGTFELTVANALGRLR